MRLRTAQSGNPPHLRKRSGMAGAVALHRIDGLGYGFGRRHKSQTPTGHRPRLGKAVNDNRMIVMLPRKRRRALMRCPPVKQPLVNLVAHQINALLHANIPQQPRFLRRINGSRGIAGRVQYEQTSAIGDGFRQLLRQNLEGRLFGCRQDNRPCSRQLGHFRVAHPVRRRDNHLIARIANRHNGVVARMLAAATDDNLRRRIAQPVLLPKLGRNRLAQFPHAAAGRILRKAIGQRLGRRLLDMLRSVKVRLSGAKANHVSAFGPHLLGLRRNSQSQRRRQRSGAV